MDTIRFWVAVQIPTLVLETFMSILDAAAMLTGITIPYITAWAFARIRTIWVMHTLCLWVAAKVETLVFLACMSVLETSVSSTFTKIPC